MRAAVTSTGKKNKCWAKVKSVFPNVTTHTIISAFPPGCSSFSENHGIAGVGGTSGDHQGLKQTVQDPGLDIFKDGEFTESWAISA